MAKAARPVKFREKWRIRWLDHEGKRQSAMFDGYTEAERELRARQSEVDAVRAGRRSAPPPEHTFDELADYWLEHRASEKRSKADDESIIRRHLRPSFGKLSLRAITTQRIDGYKAARTELAAKTVGNHLTLLGTMLRLAAELGWVLTVPAIHKPHDDPDDDTDQPWLKTPEEIRRFLEAARSEIEAADPLSEVPFMMYSTAVYTGMRAGELAGLRWADVDLERRTIHVRRSYDGKTKTRASRRHVPVMDALLPTLRAWKLRCPLTEGDVVFPNRADERGARPSEPPPSRMHAPSARIFQEILHRVLDRAGFVRPAEGRGVHVIHFHSLRHTFACHWRLNGGPLEELIRVMGHTSKAMTEHYANVGGYHQPAHFAIFRVPGATPTKASLSAGR